jgi:predicted nucleotidyltransferase
VTELNQLLQRLAEAKIDFVIVGGFAAMLHGSSLLTRDLDVCAILTSENVEKLREVFRELHPVHRMTSPRISFLDNPDSGIPLNNLYLQTDLGPLDLLSKITGVGDFERVRAASIQVELFGQTVNVMAIEDLIQAKQAIGREKDWLAVKELRAIVEKKQN